MSFSSIKISGLPPAGAAQLGDLFPVVRGGATMGATFPPQEGSFVGTVYVDSVNGDDDNNGLSPGTPVQTLAHAFSLCDNGYLIWIAPLSYFPTFDISVEREITLYSPMIGTIEGEQGGGAGQPVLGGTFTLTDDGLSNHIGRLNCINLNFANSTGDSFVILNATTYNGDFYATNCYFNITTAGSIPDGTVISCLQNMNGRLFLQDCYANINRGDTAANGNSAIVYITGSAWCTTTIKDSRLNVSHENDNFFEGVILTNNTSSSPSAPVILENNLINLSNFESLSNANVISSISATTNINGDNNSIYLFKQSGDPASVTLFKSNTSTGYINFRNTFCDYGQSSGEIFSDVNVVMADTAAASDLIFITGSFNTAGNICPNIVATGGSNTVKFNIINGLGKKLISAQGINTQAAGYTLLTSDWGDGAYVKVLGDPVVLTDSSLLQSLTGGQQLAISTTIVNASGSPMNIDVQGGDVLHGSSTIAAGGIAQVYYEGIISGDGTFRVV